MLLESPSAVSLTVPDVELDDFMRHFHRCSFTQKAVGRKTFTSVLTRKMTTYFPERKKSFFLASAGRHL